MLDDCLLLDDCPLFEPFSLPDVASLLEGPPLAGAPFLPDDWPLLDRPFMYDFDPGIIGAPNGFGATCEGVDVPVETPVRKGWVVTSVAGAFVAVVLAYCIV